MTASVDNIDLLCFIRNEVWGNEMTWHKVSPYKGSSIWRRLSLEVVVITGEVRSYWTCETVFVETWSKWSVSKDNEKIWQILQIAGIVLFVLCYLQYLFTARKYQIDLQEQNNFNLQYNNEVLNLPEKSSSNKNQVIFFQSIPSSRVQTSFEAILTLNFLLGIQKSRTRRI